MSVRTCLSWLVFAAVALPLSGSKYEGTFAGESICPGQFATVNVNDAYASIEASAIVQAVAESFAIAADSVSSATSEAASVARLVLTVTARAVATVDARINSPKPGCWSIAYGEAEARAVATAVVDAIAEGISQAAGPDVAAFAFSSAESRQRSVADAVASVAILLAKGDGSGFLSASGTAVAEAKATAVNCALAYAYSAVFEGTQADVEAIAEAGCPEPPPLPKDSGSRGVSPCGCYGEGSSTPAGCGSWSGYDEICYVSPACSCALSSDQYPGNKWRFCGGSLDIMKSYLAKYDKDNNIFPYGGENGYCPNES
eukprot:TRINITY_DN3372_c0_g1_i1.p1 TRINITY_DN3372_c0_g1~~TRINITY_DN3372_c0_g1_i1.p1  ORF type:complete len:315 (+),score=44.40 TRINITY_DN3372_c0_g1_i1:135-1079(+)